MSDTCPTCNGTGWEESDITNAECRKEGYKVTCRTPCPRCRLPRPLEPLDAKQVRAMFAAKDAAAHKRRD